MRRILIVIISLMILNCTNSDSVSPNSSNGMINEEYGIEAVPSILGSDYTSNFSSYTKYVAPNGKPIHILAQNKISLYQIVRSKNILSHYLENLSGSMHGNDKSEIANNMANNGAKLLLLNGRDDGSNDIDLDGQYLFEEEIQVEGSDWYINQDYYNHRDATFEEILHLVHDFGIGVDGPNTFPGAAPEFQIKIRNAQNFALENNVWGLNAEEWISELSEENSLSQEYLASVIDVYYGLWGAWSGNLGMYDCYLPKTRDDLQSKDPLGSELVNSVFFHDYLTYNALIDSTFEGIFSLRFNPDKLYTNHSQYLKDITLTGASYSSVQVNSNDNILKGNRGINKVYFSGNYEDYLIEKDNSKIKITDSIQERDGINIVSDFEYLEFIDKSVDVNEF